MLDKKLKARWVKALRSGRYKQGKGYLQDKDGKNCCLGVLCRISRIKEEMDHLKIGGGFLFAGAKNFGLRSHVQSILAELNDNDVSSFEAIADFIESATFI